MGAPLELALLSQRSKVSWYFAQGKMEDTRVTKDTGCFGRSREIDKETPAAKERTV